LNAEVGGSTNPALLGIATSAGLCELADLSSWRVETAVPEQDAGSLAVGQKCEAKPVGAADVTLRGTVVQIAPVVDRARGTVAVQIKLDDLPRDFVPRVDAGVNVRFLVK